jgi:uncharacterized Zn finger protein
VSQAPGSPLPGRPVPPRAAAPPRKVRNGLRPGLGIDALARDFRAAAWIEAAHNAHAFETGAAFAAAGQVASLAFEPGAAVALVQDARKTPYRAVIHVPPFDAVRWDRVVAALSDDAPALASIMAGELSPVAIDALRHADADLVIRDAADLRVECACGERGCRHSVAATLVAADRLVASPGDFLLLRGMELPVLLERLRRERAIEQRGSVSAHPEPDIAAAREPALALEEMLDRFWSPPPDLAVERGADGRGTSRHVSHALLRRLGAPPIQGRFPILGLLASVYDEVSQRAREMVDQPANDAEDRAETDAPVNPVEPEGHQPPP